MDYRDTDTDEPFDRILSIGMFEHVGHKNCRVYMQMARRRLEGNGLFLLHCIGGNVSVHETDLWLAWRTGIGTYSGSVSMRPSTACGCST